MLNKLVVFVLIGIIAAILVVTISIQNAGVGVSQPPQSNQAIANTLSEEEIAALEKAETLRDEAYSTAYYTEFAALEAKESAVRTTVYADERIQDYIAGAYSSQSDLIRADLTDAGTDVLLIYVVGDRLPIEGDWKTSYKKTYTGIFELKVSVKGGQIVSIEKIPKDDVIHEETFSDSKKNALEIAFANPEVAAAVEGKDFVVAGVMAVSHSPGCGPESCVFIFLEQPTKKDFLSLWFNTSTSEVFEMSKGEGW
ncbi:MAG: hypothetical protein ACREBU_02815 [Nitrososphaera sp.]